MCKIWEVYDMIEEYKKTKFEYQETQYQACEDLVRAIFKLLGIEEDYD